ncbi:MAG TPA: PRTRC system protein C, partial [Terriglobales bacterium]
RVSTTKSEWLPDDPTAFVPTRLWKLPFITTWDDSRNQNRPTDSAEEAEFRYDNLRLPDIGQKLTVEEVRTAYSATYPEIATASVTGPEAIGNNLVYHFTKAIGTKG